MRGLRLTMLALLAPLPAAMTLCSVSSADLDGGYYCVASRLCDLANAQEAEAPMRCSPEPTAGSIYNLIALGEGQLDLAIAQSDWQKHAWQGTLVFAARGALGELRSVMSLSPRRRRCSCEATRA